MLVTTGNPDWDAVVTEVLDLEDPDNVCQDYLPYPNSFGKYAASGGLMDNKTPMICGGAYASDKCLFLGNEDTQATMISERYFASELMVNNSLWITGGYNGTHSLQSTEYVRPGESSILGPRLPKTMYQHCAVMINETSFAFTGGYIDDLISDEVYFYQSESHLQFRIYSCINSCDKSRSLGATTKFARTSPSPWMWNDQGPGNGRRHHDCRWWSVQGNH